ncbi:hypothetical protein ACE6H2_010565 [Prunus campanulata]
MLGNQGQNVGGKKESLLKSKGLCIKGKRKQDSKCVVLLLKEWTSSWELVCSREVYLTKGGRERGQSVQERAELSLE